MKQSKAAYQLNAAKVASAAVPTEEISNALISEKEPWDVAQA